MSIWEEVFAQREWGKYPPVELVKIATNFARSKSKTTSCLELGPGGGANTILLEDLFDNYSAIDISENPNVEYIDQHKIKNKKLQLRVWREGDAFRPLGMSGKQKISDFLTNKKLNRFEKFNQSVLCADDEIIWLCGHRIDDRYKISDETTKFISLKRVKKYIAQ